MHLPALATLGSRACEGGNQGWATLHVAYCTAVLVDSERRQVCSAADWVGGYVQYTQHEDG